MVPWTPGTQRGWGRVRTPDKVGRKQAPGQGFWASYVFSHFKSNGKSPKGFKQGKQTGDA